MAGGAWVAAGTGVPSAAITMGDVAVDWLVVDGAVGAELPGALAALSSITRIRPRRRSVARTWPSFASATRQGCSLACG